jgi:hypothetical protein
VPAIGADVPGLYIKLLTKDPKTELQDLNRQLEQSAVEIDRAVNRDMYQTTRGLSHVHPYDVR